MSSWKSTVDAITEEKLQALKPKLAGLDAFWASSKISEADRERVSLIRSTVTGADASEQGELNAYINQTVSTFMDAAFKSLSTAP